jgi:hypothetical protein
MSEKIQGTIRAARDSVWVIENELQKLSEGTSLTEVAKGNIERNVEHLKIVVSNSEISESGEDISDLHAAISAGEAELNK